MSTSLAELSDGAAVQPFVAMGKSLKDSAALCGFVKQVISAASVYVFGEILALDGVKSMANLDDNAKSHFQLLNIYAYGTYTDYKQNQDRLPKLSKPQEIKLKQLTIVNLASKSRVIPYKTLLGELDVANVRELEDLIIDSIYQGLLTGKLDQQKSIFIVDETFGRDVRLEIDGENMVKTLDAWVTRSDSLLKTIEDRIAWAQREAESAKKHQEEYKKRLDDIKATVKASVDADASESGIPAHLMGDYDMDDKRRGKGRPGGKSKGRDFDMHGGPGGFPGHGGPGAFGHRDPRGQHGAPGFPGHGGPGGNQRNDPRSRGPGRNM